MKGSFDKMVTTPTANQPAGLLVEQTTRRMIRDGFTAILPLWPGVASFAVTLGVIARSAGYSALETQMMSMLVFAGSAQLAMITLYAGGAGAITIILTALILNLRHVLYGLAADRQIGADESPPRPVLALFLTDESYGIATRAWTEGRGSAAFMLGTGVSLYTVFAVSTLAGILFGSQLPDVERSGLAFIFPLTFLALLLPMLRLQRHIAVALVAGGLALGANQVMNSGAAILMATVVAAALGVWFERQGRRA